MESACEQLVRHLFSIAWRVGEGQNEIAIICADSLVSNCLKNKLRLHIQERDIENTAVDPNSYRCQIRTTAFEHNIRIRFISRSTRGFDADYFAVVGHNLNDPICLDLVWPLVAIGHADGIAVTVDEISSGKLKYQSLRSWPLDMEAESVKENATPGQ